MVIAHREMQVGVVACEAHFRTNAYKDGLGSALNKYVLMRVSTMRLFSLVMVESDTVFS